jgi:YHS domain-containing protein
MRFIILVIAVYVLYRILKGILGAGKDDHRGRAVNGEAVEELVQDAYCKLYVPRRDSVKRVIGGQTHFFCSEECARRYELESGDRRQKTEDSSQ